MRSQADALRAYSRQVKEAEMENIASMIKLCAERRAGELLIQMAGSGERRAAKGGRPKRGDTVSHLPDLGISAKQSERWQETAAVSEDELETYITQRTEKGQPVSAGEVKRKLKKAQRKPSGRSAEFSLLGASCR